MKPKCHILSLIFLYLCISINAQANKDSNYNARIEFEIYSEGKSYYGYYDTTKLSELEANNYHSLIAPFVSDDYILENAIVILDRNETSSDGPFSGAFREITSDTTRSKYKYSRKYQCKKFIDDSTYISGIKVKDSKWSKRKDKVLEYYSKLKSSVEVAIDELENSKLIKYKGKKDTCFKIVKILNSNDTVARFDLWENFWGKAYRARIVSFDFDWSSKNINSIVVRLDYWAKFDIYTYLYWQNCSEFHEYFDDYDLVVKIQGGKIIESKSGIAEYKKLFYKIEERR